MRKTFDHYQAVIKRLPLTESYDKKQLLINDFLVDREGKLEIYYAPHNEYINGEAKVMIVGITPGFQQMNAAMVAAKKGLTLGETQEEILYQCKVAGRFSGSLRRNIIAMLEELGLPQQLNIAKASDLFGEQDCFLHTSSLVPFPVFINGQNYSGHTPKLLKCEFLMNFVRTYFLHDLHLMSDQHRLLIIPLGKAVESVLVDLAEEGMVNHDQILYGFPHPSGANGHRWTQFEENKVAMQEIIERVLAD